MLISNQMIAMRDGIRLATDIYLPDDMTEDNSWPVVLERTPYDKTAHSRSEINADGTKISREQMAQAFNKAGFVMVFQDCRGRYRSEGNFVKYLNEAEDGIDTLNWLAEQSWCNGNIGTMGLSYAAHTQLALACLNPPQLKTMILDSGGFANAYQCGIRQGGAFELKQATWAFKQAKNSPKAKTVPHILAALNDQDIHTWFTKMPWLKGHNPLSSLPEYEAYLLKQWQHGVFDEFWQKIGIYAEGYYDNIPDIPILHMSSWYDAYVSSTLQNFSELTQRKTAPQHLIMGPWLHGDRNITHSGEVQFGQSAQFDGNLGLDWLSYRLAWFAKHLQNKNTSCDTPKVSIFVMGGGQGNKTEQNQLNHGGYWCHDTQFPFTNSQKLTFYCTKEYQLSLQKPSEDDCIFFESDPNHPIPTIGGAITSGKPVYVGGAFDQRERPDFFGTDGSNQPLTARHDIVSFQTPPLTEDLVVAGDIEVHVWLTCDAPDCDITVKLVDVYPACDDYPHGFSMNLTDGIMRARYRHSWSKPTMMTGEKVKLTVKPFATANVFKKGHCIRLDIAGSNFPHFDCNPNSGEPEGQARHKQIAKNTLHLGGEFATKLCLTVSAMLPPQ